MTLSLAVPDILVARAKAGDEEALEALYRAFETPVYNLARRMLRHAEDAEDVLQETFLEVVRSIGGYRGEGSLWGWIRQIAASKALMRIRRERPPASARRFLEARAQELGPRVRCEDDLGPELAFGLVHGRITTRDGSGLRISRRRRFEGPHHLLVIERGVPPEALSFCEMGVAFELLRLVQPRRARERLPRLLPRHVGPPLEWGFDLPGRIKRIVQRGSRHDSIRFGPPERVSRSFVRVIQPHCIVEAATTRCR